MDEGLKETHETQKQSSAHRWNRRAKKNRLSLNIHIYRQTV